MDQRWSLLISQPNPLQGGVRILLGSISQVGEINQVSNVEAALCMDENHHPLLVLLIADPASGALDEVITQLRRKWPRTRYVIMVDDERDLHIAQTIGADSVLLKGCMVSKLIEAIEHVLPTSNS